MVDQDQTQTDEKIIRAARKEFAENGLAGSRVDRIANRAGVNKAMIYYHFGSKDKLYETVITRQLDKLREFIRNNQKVMDRPEEILRNLAEFYITLFDEIRDFLPILFHELSTGGSMFKEMLKNIEGQGPAGFLAEALEEGKSQGKFRDVDVRHALISFAGMNLFYLIAEPIVNHTTGIDDEKAFKKARPEAVVDLFLNGIRRKES